MRVVERPVGDRRAGDARRERIRRLHQAHQRHVAAVAPAEHADALRVDEGQAAQEFDAAYLVLHLDIAHAKAERSLEALAAHSAAAIVEREDDVAVLHQVLMEQTAPRIGDALRARAAIDVDEHRITLARFEVARLQQLVVHRLAVGRRDGAELRAHVFIEIPLIRMRGVELIGQHRRQQAPTAKSAA